MAVSKRQSAGHIYLIWLTTIIAIISALAILVLAIYASHKMIPDIVTYQDSLAAIEQFLAQLQIASYENDSRSAIPAEVFNTIDTFLKSHFSNISLSITSTNLLITFLMGAIVLILILLISQSYMWHKDRQKLELWRESGFLCERLEFLPANRLKLNNIELELKKTQIDNLIKIAKSRKRGKPIHALEIGDHGPQATNRLREELGKKFIEKSLIKHRKQEGYWLEVESDRIHFQPE